VRLQAGTSNVVVRVAMATGQQHATHGPPLAMHILYHISDTITFIL